MTAIPESQMFELNRRKVYKWVFLLLERHHERLGLKVLAWSGPQGIGTPYFTFYFDAVKNDEGHIITQFDLGDRNSNHSMTMYQGLIGLPEWAVGDQMEHPDQSILELRTEQLLSWYEQHLRVIDCSQPLWSCIDTTIQQRLHWSAAVERYLLSWRMLGHVMASLPEFVPLETVGESTDPAYGVPDYVRDVDRFLPEMASEDIVILTGKPFKQEFYWLHAGRVYTMLGECLDFYQMIKGGYSFGDVLSRIKMFLSRPSKGKPISM